MSEHVFEDIFSKKIWEDKYKDIKDETVQDTWRRVARALAQAEPKDKDEWEEKFYNILAQFNTMGGRTLANLGTGSKGTSEFNCFVLNARLDDSFKDKGIDSMESIMFMLKEMALTLKSEGGYGTNASFLRPRGTYIKGIKSETPGSVTMLEMWNTISDVITTGAGQRKDVRAKKAIRKGAMMIVEYVWHPDIEEFIEAKQVAGRLTKFNMSVGITDNFMKAVQADMDWDLIFPDVECRQYNTEWDGDIQSWKAKNLPIKVYRTVKAKDLYNKIMKATYNRAEPGVLFLDRANHLNNLAYCETIHASNPCFGPQERLLTTQGFLTFEELDGQEIEIININNEVVKSKVWNSGIKNTLLIRNSLGEEFVCTPEHKWMLNTEDVCEAKDLKGKRLLPFLKFKQTFIADYVKLGFIQGDGNLSRLKSKHRHKGFEINIGGEDKEILDLFGFKRETENQRKFYTSDYYELCKHLMFSDKVLPFRTLPSTYFTWSKIEKLSFLKGMFSANGSVIDGNRIALKTTCKELIFQVISALSEFNISAYYTTNKNKIVDFNNGSYECKESYDINIAKYNHILEFYKIIGFMQEYKTISLICLLKKKSPVITSVHDNGECEVYDFNEPETNWGVVNGYIAHNCGEQPLASGNVCNLGSLNLMNYINEKRDDWDYEKLKIDIPIHIRMLDNVNTIGKAPLDIQNKNKVEKRRIGQGVLGYASALMYMKVRYGSPEALKLTKKFCKFWANESYKASAMIAQEKDVFPLYKKEEYLKSNYLKILDKSTINLISKYGIRNSHVLSIAPSGNTSTYANVVSGGLEPIFNAEYIRTVIVNDPPDGLTIYRRDEIVWDNTNKKYSAYESETHATVYWDWFKEGDEDMLKIKHTNGKIYKIDRNRGLTMEVLCMDQAVRKLKALKEWDSKAEWAKTALKLSPEDHIETMKIFAKYVDSAVSKTVNLPHNFSFKNFRNLYMSVWKTGYIKGFTTYRDKTMGSVLKEAEEHSNGKEIIVKDHIKLPKNSPSDTITIESEDNKWYVTTCYWPGVSYKKPFAMFVKTNNTEKKEIMKNTYNHLIALAREKKIPKGLIDDQVEKCKNVGEVDKVMRAVSLNLRHGVHIKNIVNFIEQCEPPVGSLIYHIKKYLQSFISDGVETGTKCPVCKDNLVYSEGCKKCKSCSYSAC